MERAGLAALVATALGCDGVLFSGGPSTPVGIGHHLQQFAFTSPSDCDLPLQMRFTFSAQLLGIDPAGGKPQPPRARLDWALG